MEYFSYGDTKINCSDEFASCSYIHGYVTFVRLSKSFVVEVSLTGVMSRMGISHICVRRICFG